MKFKYKFQLVGDGKYGSKNPTTGEWNGMIRELQDQVGCLQQMYIGLYIVKILFSHIPLVGTPATPVDTVFFHKAVSRFEPEPLAPTVPRWLLQ